MATSISTPLSEATIRALKVGDEVLISGLIYTGRDAVHKHLYSGWQLPGGPERSDHLPLRAGHAGQGGALPGGRRRPHHVIGEEPYQAAMIIEKFGLRGVIGKGGDLGAATASRS